MCYFIEVSVLLYRCKYATLYMSVCYFIEVSVLLYRGRYAILFSILLFEVVCYVFEGDMLMF